MSDYLVEIRLMYRVTNVTSEFTAERSVKSLLFNSGDMWHDEDKVGVERLSMRSVVELETEEFNEMEGPG